ncbi:LOW QUALITY PROTEIN: uncharacterized protein FPRO_14329 [Fusarium proliferatum ET1]|uniref:Related to carboxyphosphonoenolpyruvate phosphonomutase-like protein n=1 Tax=Fusarium proliferatum (strain ET1) TaxID=1227346 RepID=A0A1L7VX31_FUSPR|nr:LOW QUALITY PROTEIN: uncharacterized protein FPRO_14329 [Fusarium proliferatum ET1]CZR44576.1 related to carboxyphosphonoenolpyruvate phosphonomutase-like protein [Fusarium proliferatum ET1]
MELIQLSQPSKSLHFPYQTLVFATVWDLASLNIVLGLNSEASKPFKAIATALWAFTAYYDEELTTVYGVEFGFDSNFTAKVASAGAHGTKIEDIIPARGLGQGIEKSLYPLDEQIHRLKLAVRSVADAGLPDIVINAHCDVFALQDDLKLNHETCMKEAVKRGKGYLDARRGYGAGFTEGDVQTAIRLGQTRAALSVLQLAKLGVARINVGSGLFQIAMNAAKKSAISVLEGGLLEEV